MNGTDGSTTFVDSSSSNKTITVHANSAISTDDNKFGSASAEFDGSSHLSCNSSDFAFGTGDFTIEWWQKVSSQDLLFTDQHGVIQISASSGGLASSPYTNGMRIAFGVVGNGSIGVKMGNTDVTSSTGVLTANTWQHLSVVRNSNTVKIFLNGSEIASGTNSENITSQNLAIGGYIDSRFLMNGYVDELRITKGVARYTADFTPQTREFYPGTGVEDITSNLNGVNNGATFETTSPANYSFSSGDYIQVPDGNLLDPVNITVLTWAYKSDWGESSPVSQRLISKYPNTGSSGWLQYLTGDSGLFKNVIYVGGTRYEANINATSISSGWHQVVFTYDGSSFKFYIDASLEQTNSNMSGDLSSNSTDLFIGNQQDSSNSPVNNDSGRYFNGKVAIVKIYDSALSEADITSEFNYHKSTFGL